MKSTIAGIAGKYLKLSNYNIDSKTLELQLETHPDFPSFKSVSDTFDYFGIENVVATVPVNVFDQLPDSFITLYRREGDLKLILVKKKKNGVVIFDENLKKGKLSIPQFKENWDGTIIAVEENNQKNKAEVSFSFKRFDLIIFSIIAIINLLNNNSNIQEVLYVILSLIGLSISYFIVKESFGIHNETVAKVCETISKTNGCSNVINDKKSKLFGVIPLSDASVVYFLISVLFLTIIGFDFSLLFCISVCSLPIVVFTLYYQRFVLKQWCALCLGVSAVLVLQFLVLIFNYKALYFDFNLLLKFLFVAAFVVIIWHSLKLLWVENSKLTSVESDFLKFKRNKSLFDTLLKKEELINNNLIATENKIVFGSDNPLLTINAITNPLCGFCVESFQTYFKLLKTHSDIQVNFIFSVPFEDKDNVSTQIIFIVLDLYRNESKEKALIALHEWYEERAIDKWQSKYKMPTTYDGLFGILKSHQNWLKVNNILHTPATNIGNYYFPKAYNIDDLLLFVDDMLEEKKRDLVII